MVKLNPVAHLENMKIIIDDINIKYNFRIQPVNNNKKIISDREEKGSFIFFLYPEILDFTKEDI